MLWAGLHVTGKIGNDVILESSISFRNFANLSSDFAKFFWEDERENTALQAGIE